jgi:hypothetical protein
MKSDLLKETGIEMPPPDELDDKKLIAKLWDVIHALLSRSIIICNTDHLDDRELYTLLWKEFLHEVHVITPNDALYIDATRTGPDDGMPIYLKYYATESQRELYSEIHPDFEMPDHVEPPRRRDHLIPRDPGNTHVKGYRGS